VFVYDEDILQLRYIEQMHFSENLNIPHKIKVPNFCPSREKHGLGLWQLGKPLTNIPTIAQMLEIVFDILEGNLSPIFCIP